VCPQGFAFSGGPHIFLLGHPRLPDILRGHKRHFSPENRGDNQTKMGDQGGHNPGDPVFATNFLTAEPLGPRPPGFTSGGPPQSSRRLYFVPPFPTQGFFPLESGLQKGPRHAPVFGTPRWGTKQGGSPGEKFLRGAKNRSGEDPTLGASLARHNPGVISNPFSLCPGNPTSRVLAPNPVFSKPGPKPQQFATKLGAPKPGGPNFPGGSKWGAP